jgi:hypothetical protein
MRWSFFATRLGRALCVSLVCAAGVACEDDLAVEQPRTVSSVALLTRLSQHGLYRDVATRTPSAVALEYEPQYPLFSDYAEKRRWLLLPADTRIDTSDMDHWRFPLGTKVVKEFSRDGKPLETRLIQKVADTGDPKTDFFMGTFVWLPDGSDAMLNDQGVDNVHGTTHDVPKQELCLRCHQGEPGAVLGFSALQLSPNGMLATLTQKNLLSDPPKRTFAIPGNDLQVKALGVLQGNCAHCHTAGGSGALMRLRLLPHEVDLPFELTEIFQTTIGRPLTDWTPRPPEFTRRILPGDPDKSALSYRMGLRSGSGVLPDQMPPIATEVIEPNGLATVRAWIAAMPRDWLTLAPALSFDGGVELPASSYDAAVWPTDGAVVLPSIDAYVPGPEDASAPLAPNASDASVLTDSADSAVPDGAVATPANVEDAGTALEDAGVVLPAEL